MSDSQEDIIVIGQSELADIVSDYIDTEYPLFPGQFLNIRFLQQPTGEFYVTVTGSDIPEEFDETPTLH